MSERLDPLPESLRALVDAEKACPDPRPAVADKVFGRLSATLGLAVATSAAATTAHASTVPASSVGRWLLGHAPYRTLLTFLVGATTGVAGYATVSHVRSSAHPASSPGVTSPAPSPSSPPLPEAPQPAAEPALSPPAVAPPAAASSPASSSTRSRDEHLAAERHLIEMARTALARGRAEGAFATLRRHARQFPQGQLSEERDSLLIQALVANGDVAQARERAEVFHRRYPSSLFAPAIDQALRSSAPR